MFCSRTLSRRELPEEEDPFRERQVRRRTVRADEASLRIANGRPCDELSVAGDERREPWQEPRQCDAPDDAPRVAATDDGPVAPDGARMGPRGEIRLGIASGRGATREHVPREKALGIEDRATAHQGSPVAGADCREAGWLHL